MNKRRIFVMFLIDYAYHVYPVEKFFFYSDIYLLPSYNFAFIVWSIVKTFDMNFGPPIDADLKCAPSQNSTFVIEE